MIDTEAVIDTGGDEVPIQLGGDFNVRLPKSKCNQNWSKSKGFSIHDRMLYDFIVGNKFLSLNKLILIPLDHIISTKYDMRKVSSIYTNILSFNYVPAVFDTGVIVPVLKKPTLSRELPSHYCIIRIF